MSETNRFLSRRQVAEQFGVSPSTVTRWAGEGMQEAIHTPGGQYRFPGSASMSHRRVRHVIANFSGPLTLDQCAADC